MKILKIDFYDVITSVLYLCLSCLSSIFCFHGFVKACRASLLASVVAVFMQAMAGILTFWGGESLMKAKAQGALLINLCYIF